MAYSDASPFEIEDTHNVRKPRTGETERQKEARLAREERNRAKKKYKPKHLRDLGRERK